MGARGRLTLALLAVVAALAGRAAAGPSTYSGLVVDQIRFDAPPSVPVAELSYLIEIEVGDTYRPLDVRRSVELLYGLGQFDEVYVSVLPDGVRLIVTFHLVPSPTIQRVGFRGLPAAVPRGLARQALSARLGEPFSPGDDRRITEDLRLLLVREGFLDATVDVVVERPDDVHVALELVVAAGAPHRVREVAFNPGAGLSAARLRRSVDVSSMTGTRLRTEVVEEGRAALERLYRRQGYLEARVLPPIIEPVEGEAAVRVLYNVVPGSRIEVEFLEVADPGRTEVAQAVRGPRARRLETVIGVQREYRLSSGFIQDADARLEQDYRDRGFADVAVDGALEVVGGVKRLRFRAVLGPRSVLASGRDIAVHGNDVLTEREIRWIVLDRLPKKGGKGSPRRVRATDDGVIDAIDDVLGAYRAQGYLDATVEKVAVHHDERGAGPLRSSIELTIREGVQTRVRAVEVRGNVRVSDGEVQALAEPLIGEPLWQPAVDRVLGELRALYGERGCVDMVVHVDEDMSEDGTEATLIWTVEEGQQVRFGKVVVRGNRHTRTRLLRNRLSIEPGHLWLPGAVEESRERLMETGLLTRARIGPLNESGRIRDVLVDVAERRRWRLMLGPGISSAEGLRLSVENTLSNIGGVGHSWTTVAHLGIDWENLRQLLAPSGELTTTEGIKGEWRIVTGYEIPVMLPEPIRINLRVLLNERVLQPTYIVQNYGFGASGAWSHKLPELPVEGAELRLLWGVRLLWRYPEDVDPAAVLTDADVVDEDFRSRFMGLFGSQRPPDSLRRLLLFHVGVQWDMRDDPFNPTKGFLLSGDLDGTDLSGASQEAFGRARVRFSVHLPLIEWARRAMATWPFDIATGIDAGVGWVGPGTEMLPVEWRYRLGGATSVRGYLLETLGPTVERPRDLTGAGFTGSTIEVPVGGDVYYSFNVEERIPLSRSRSLELILFQDGGNAYLRSGPDRDDLDRGFDPVIRTSAGVGVRIRTPVGPLRLDVGFQLGASSPLFDSVAGNGWRGMALHFSIGEL